MKRRVQRVASKALGTAKRDLPWSGTFHSIGARLLREYARRIGLKPSFTILDRSDAADLMNLVRHELDQSKKESRFPKKDTCLSTHSLTVNSGAALERILSTRFQWCAAWGDELRTLFAGYVKAKQRQNVGVFSHHIYGSTCGRVIQSSAPTRLSIIEGWTCARAAFIITRRAMQWALNPHIRTFSCSASLLFAALRSLFAASRPTVCGCADRQVETA